MQFSGPKKKNTFSPETSELLYGPHPLIECCKAKRRKVLAVYTTQPTPKSFSRILAFLPSYTTLNYVSKDVLTRMAGTPDHGGVVAYVSTFNFVSRLFDPSKKRFILLLDAIQDVRNLGAILRSAYCVGIDGVVLCKKNGAPLSPAVFKASAGLAEHLDIYQASSLVSAVIDLKKAGYTMYMAVLEEGKSAMEISYSAPLCLVIGNEAQGIGPEIRKQGVPITLPQVRPDISYNASVACGILLFILSYGKKS